MRALWPGKPFPRGATFDGRGVNFAVYSRVATRVDVCLFDSADAPREAECLSLTEVAGHTWHGYIPGLEPGALYGLRVDGPHAPERGHRCNPNKLLVDPYAKAIVGQPDWKGPVLGYKHDDERADLSFDDTDSAPAMPRCVVVDDAFDWGDDRPPDVSWRHTTIYELNVRGFTKLHPEVPENERGTYAGLGHPAAVGYLKNLGITAVELLPVHAFVDDGFLVDKGLRNYWGYSTLGFFAPEARYASNPKPGAQVAEFKAMVKALHAAGIEVILDVVFNHTCEGNHLGPTLSLRGIDNATYYWLMPDCRYYLDFTGTGNSLNASMPETARLIVDSLRYWVNEMHVDGFRFDLATTIGRIGAGEFDSRAPIFQIISQDPVLSRVKLIAEPWDVGLGGYQVGNFPHPFREWNGKFRDAIRRYWKGDDNLAAEIGYRLSGSADLYQGERRQPQASINFVTAHDGFTLHDLVSYSEKHNEANRENNQDGTDDNLTWNHGVEGETEDAGVIALRERQMRNLLATVFLAQGVPMILGGDEMGRTQHGNNNAYCQDNDLSWFDWKLDERRRNLVEFTRQMIQLRRRHPVLQRRRFFVGDYIWESEVKDLAWLRPDGVEMTPLDWQKPWIASLAMMLGGDAIQTLDERGERLVDDAVLVLMNAHHEPIAFSLPTREEGDNTWLLDLDTGRLDAKVDTPSSGSYEVGGRSLVVLRQPLEAEARKAAAKAPERAATKEAQRRQRRAGVVIPLFAIRPKGGWGIGGVGDIAQFAGWAASAGFSVLQLLPVNPTSGIDASPYSAVSAFAIDPVYLSLDSCEDFVAAGGRSALSEETQKKLAAAEASSVVDWPTVRAVKHEAIAVAFARFKQDEWGKSTGRARQLGSFIRQHRHWLDDYTIFAAWHEQFGKSWLDWPAGPRDRDPGAIAAARHEHGDAILCANWIQWQLDLQWRKARRDASAAGVELMGDLPFMVGLDSADVWSNRKLFRVDQHVGTAPDDTSPDGQDWGLPVYDWHEQQHDNYSWIRSRATRSGALFGMYRLDHVLGYYRTFFRSVDGRTSGFTPADEASQVHLGESIMRIMSRWGEVVAEDLGNVPPFLRPSLDRLGIPGYRVLRWEKDGEVFRDPASWPATSVATNSTHDTTTTAEWYDALTPKERAALLRLPRFAGLDPDRAYDDDIRVRVLETLYAAPSTLTLVLFEDVLGTRERINVPGTVSVTNWSYRTSKTTDELLADKATTERLASLATESRRRP
jgi:glycogen operon protein